MLQYPTCKLVHIYKFFVDSCFPLCSQVTLLQLEKTYGKGKDAKEFIQELIKGHLFATMVFA